MHIETSYFLISRISQDLQRIFTSASIFFNLYKVLFIYKKSGTFDDVVLIWRASIVDFFLTKKESYQYAFPEFDCTINHSHENEA